MSTTGVILPLDHHRDIRPRWVDFYELLKPRMNLLILGTTFVGYFMAAPQPADAWHILPHVLLGTALCAAGAAILNQYLERRQDALMPRTAGRPLPTGRISPNQALILGLLAGALGTIYLLLLVNFLTALGIAGSSVFTLGIVSSRDAGPRAVEVIASMQ